VALEDDRRHWMTLGGCWRKAPALSRVDGHGANVLVARAHCASSTAGDTIFLRIRRATAEAILDGNVADSVPRPKAKEIVLGILQPGEVFARIAILMARGARRRAELTRAALRSWIAAMSWRLRAQSLEPGQSSSKSCATACRNRSAPRRDGAARDSLRLAKVCCDAGRPRGEPSAPKI